MKTTNFSSWRMLTVALALMTFSAKAQLGSRFVIEADKRITKKIKLDGNIQMRNVDFAFPADKYIGELGVVFNLPKGFEADVYYRYIHDYKPKKETYSPKHRFYGDVSYKKDLTKSIELQYRVRYQNQFKDTDGEFANDKSYVRNKLEIAFPNKSKFKPSLSADLFYQLGYTFDQVRIKAETNYKVKKGQKIHAAFFTDRSLNNDFNTNYVMQLGYSFSFK